MKRLEYTVSFTTPAFLGNAEQQAQWRTPPFKALLRQWWRIVQQARSGQDHVNLRQREGLLFGNAWLKDDQDRPLHRKSNICLRLEPRDIARPSWGFGTLKTENWPSGFERVPTTLDGKTSVPADIYLGYGPVSPPSRKENRGKEIRGAIGIEQRAKFGLIVTNECEVELRQTLALVNWFGTLGSRGRNGWGSVVLTPEREAAPLPPLEGDQALLKRVGRRWDECLLLDWPHALGTDSGGKPLIWLTEELEDWSKAVGRLANVRVAVRQVAKRIRADNSPAGAIHFLGYPAGTGNKNPWELAIRDRAQEPRLASQLRFKIVPSGNSGHVRGMVFHLPCKVPQAFLDQLADDRARNWLSSKEKQLEAWSAIHDTLKADRRLRPLGFER